MTTIDAMPAARNPAPRTRRPRPQKLRVAVVAAAALAALALAACGSSSSKAATKTTAKPAATTASAAAAALVIKTAAVPGLGTILVDDKGMTLYMLEDTAGKPVPCTDASGCTKAWPDVALPDGTTAATAGTGVDAALLGTTKSPDSSEMYVTYNNWPVYTFVKDTAPGQVFGQGLQSFGGTWHVLDAKGNVVTTAATPAGSATTAGATTTTKKASSGGSSGY
ncbi:MAG: lipoprotein [Actinomycetia bacterium]|nr:lipoprotein [Actinomycetes bacterium]